MLKCDHESDKRKTEGIMIMYHEGSTKFVNFMTTRAGILVLGCGHIKDIVKIHYFYKNLLMYSQTQIRQTEGIEKMFKERSTKIVNFMTSGHGFL